MENTNPADRPVPSPDLPDTATNPDPSPAPDTPLPDPAPGLALWELMRKDVDPSCRDSDDDTDRVLAHPHISIWDLD